MLKLNHWWLASSSDTSLCPSLLTFLSLVRTGVRIQADTLLWLSRLVTSPFHHQAGCHLPEHLPDDAGLIVLKSEAIAVGVGVT